MVTSVNNQEIHQNDLVTRLRKEMKLVVLVSIGIIITVGLVALIIGIVLAFSETS